MTKGKILSPMDSVREFAKTLVKLTDKYNSTSTREFERFFGVKMPKIGGVEREFKEYERVQAIYALNKFVDTECKIIKVINIDDEEEGLMAPRYEEVRIGRHKYERLLTIGQVFFKYKKIKMILNINFHGAWRRESTLYFRLRNSKKAGEFTDGFRRFMRNHNVLKGEKLVYLSKSKLDFLEYPKLDWNNVILREDIKEEIMLNAIFPLDNGVECVASGIPWRRGLLFCGVAGTGKTQVCRVLCNKVPEGTTVIWATPKALYDADVVMILFEAARYFSPTLLIIEDIDFIGTDRSMDNDDILGELLTQLDGNDPNYGVFIVATTNRPHLLDTALANRPSRFDIKLNFEVPEPNERIKLIKLFTKRMKFKKPLDYGEMSALTNGLTGAHIKEVFVYAQLKALKRGEIKIKLEDISKRLSQYKMSKSDIVV